MGPPHPAEGRGAIHGYGWRPWPGLSRPGGRLSPFARRGRSSGSRTRGEAPCVAASCGATSLRPCLGRCRRCSSAASTFKSRRRLRRRWRCYNAAPSSRRGLCRCATHPRYHQRPSWGMGSGSPVSVFVFFGSGTDGSHCHRQERESSNIPRRSEDAPSCLVNLPIRSGQAGAACCL